MSLKGKNILLGVCGSIAAYKIASLIRLLVKAEAEVQVVMTPEATQFITPLTLSTLSKKPVFVDYYDPKTGEWNNHVHLALKADLLLVAPASANTLAKFAHGLCDNLLTACYLSAKCPVYLAPAMDLDMWKHPATRQNIE
ncbi:phosphopantothenoylcysteine decarboxylase, partial [Parapusillimonas sp. SGNA-6]|nr:phosphopantothenoylcysteine decarboxylase [Parapusillimonas sp. SGNA-6]